MAFEEIDLLCIVLKFFPPYHTMTTQFTLGQGTFGTWHILPSISMVDSVTCLRYTECSCAPDYINMVWYGMVGFLGRWGTYADCLPAVSA